MKCKTITRVIAKFDGVEYVEYKTPLKEAGGYFIEVYKVQGGKRIKLDEYAEILGQRHNVELAGFGEAGGYTVDYGDADEDEDEADDFREFDEVPEAFENPVKSWRLIFDGNSIKKDKANSVRIDEVKTNEVKEFDEGDGTDEVDEVDRISQMQEDKESAGSDWI